jgi:hypothetical protein
MFRSPSSHWIRLSFKIATPACKKAKGKFILQAFSGPECTSSARICAMDNFSGELAGTSVFIGSSLRSFAIH